MGFLHGVVNSINHVQQQAIAAAQEGITHAANEALDTVKENVISPVYDVQKDLLLDAQKQAEILINTARENAAQIIRSAYESQKEIIQDYLEKCEQALIEKYNTAIEISFDALVKYLKNGNVIRKLIGVCLDYFKAEIMLELKK